MYKTIAIIPARSGSKGLKDKNIRKIGDKHLLGYPIEAALNSKYIDKVVFSSDSESYLSIAESYKPHDLDLRPTELASDSSRRADLIIYLLNKYPEFELLVYLEPTSPFTSSIDIDRAIEQLVMHQESARSIVGICSKDTFHPKYALRKSSNGILTPYMLKNFKDLPINRQELDPVYFFDGSLYISFTDTFREEGEFYHRRTLGIELDSHKSIEIDDEMDFHIAEYLKNGK